MALVFMPLSSPSSRRALTYIRAHTRAIQVDVYARGHGLQDIDALITDSHTPFQFDRCHALRTDGAAVAQYHARWSAKPDPVAEST
jgi:hypothetical protein